MMTSIKWIMILACISLSTIGCGVKYTVKGQVIDAQTKEPIEGAVAIIHWGRDSWFPSGCIGFGTQYVRIGTYEDISDKEGKFHLSAHFKRNYSFAVYKSGYVCFNSKEKLQKGKEGIIAVRWFRLKNGMVIPLEPLTEEYNKRRHAFFVKSTSSDCEASTESAFEKATRQERVRAYYIKD